MKKIILLLGLAGAIVLGSGFDSYSQNFINKLRKKAEEKIVDEALGKEEAQEEATGEHPDRQAEGARMTNTRGGGLVHTPPDVESHLAEAEKAFGEKSFSHTRDAIRQAMLGVEMEIGQRILDHLPDQLRNLPTQEGMDQVSSSSIGFVGLTIKRIYQSSDQQVTLTVANDAAMLSAVNMYMGAGYYQESSAEPDHKPIDYKGYRGILEYDEADGYTMSVPFGQSSLMVFEAVNFANEQEVMQTAEVVDIERIKQELGEQ